MAKGLTAEGFTQVRVRATVGGEWLKVAKVGLSSSGMACYTILAQDLTPLALQTEEVYRRGRVRLQTCSLPDCYVRDDGVLVVWLRGQDHPNNTRVFGVPSEYVVDFEKAVATVNDMCEKALKTAEKVVVEWATTSNSQEDTRETPPKITTSVHHWLRFTQMPERLRERLDVVSPEERGSLLLTSVWNPGFDKTRSELYLPGHRREYDKQWVSVGDSETRDRVQLAIEWLNGEIAAGRV